MPHADAVAIGEGVQLWPRILADVEAGRLAERSIAATIAGPIATSRRRGASCCRGKAFSPPPA